MTSSMKEVPLFLPCEVKEGNKEKNGKGGEWRKEKSYYGYIGSELLDYRFHSWLC